MQLATGRGDLSVRLVPAAVAVGEVRHGKDASQQGDLLAPQAGAVAGTVVPLPVEAYRLGHPVYDLKLQNDGIAPLYIGLVKLELLLGQLPVLQHGVRQADGPHLMQQARIVAVPAGRFVQPHPAGKLLRQRGHLFAVQVHFRHFGAEGAVHGRDDLERHLREPGPLGVDARL